MCIACQEQRLSGSGCRCWQAMGAVRRGYLPDWKVRTRLSNMESTPPRPTLSEASAALRDAEAARATLADRIVPPSWFFASMGVAIAVQIAAFAVGLNDANEVAHLRLGANGPW